MFLYYKPFLWGSFRGGSTGLKVWWFSFRSFQHLSLSLVLLLPPTTDQSLAVACPGWGGRGSRGCNRGREHFTSHQPSLTISSSFLSYSTSLASSRPASVSLQHCLPSQHSWGPSGDVQHTDYTLKTSWFPYEAAGRNWGQKILQYSDDRLGIITRHLYDAQVWVWAGVQQCMMHMWGCECQ